jgi:hypothetical protein
VSNADAVPGLVGLWQIRPSQHIVARFQSAHTANQQHEERARTAYDNHHHGIQGPPPPPPLPSTPRSSIFSPTPPSRYPVSYPLIPSVVLLSS